MTRVRFVIVPAVNARTGAAVVAGNLVPLVGVVLFGWSPPSILLMYWIETGVIGLINVLKIVRSLRLAGDGGERTIARGAGRGGVIVAAGWFVTYELFWALLGIVVVDIATGGFYRGASRTGWGGVDITAVIFGTVSLVGAQVVAFVLDYVIGRRGEFVTPVELLRDPFARIVVLVGAVALGGVGTAILGSGFGFLVVLVVVKTIVELRLLAATPPPATA